MTDEIFRRDGYAFEFEAEVVYSEGDIVELDTTAFYPGGGGQVCDTGTIRGIPVTETFYRGGNIFHRVTGNNLKKGDRVWCSVDWNRRYELMKGHTGEHLLFCALKRQDPELTITKISIADDDNSVIVDHDPGWENIGRALEFANQAIRDNLPVTRSTMSRDDPDLAKVRIKLDRISEDEEISVVSIGDIDVSACSGIHVMETSELEMIFVDRKVSAGKDGTAIHFKVGRKAVDSAIRLASVSLQASDEAGSKPEDLVRWISNTKHDLEIGKNAAKALVKDRLHDLSPSNVNGTDIFSGIFPAADRTVFADAAESFRRNGGIAVLLSVGDTLSVILSSGRPGTDCKAILGKVLSEFGGRGGGKHDFAQGGVPDTGCAEAVLSRLIDEVTLSLN
ncbi:MAG: alanyl-tRNA editing protein [Candidatus Methanoplasma sp.]|jgi:alanyl-tRNA synthetase|nr:alanyl-tRNA editing protein [Candidatus Methanoplasma sp.]